MNGLVGGPGPPLKSGRDLCYVQQCSLWEAWNENWNKNKTKRLVVRLQISGMTGVLSFWDRSSAMRPPPRGEVGARA